MGLYLRESCTDVLTAKTSSAELSLFSSSNFLEGPPSDDAGFLILSLRRLFFATPSGRESEAALSRGEE